MMTDLVIGIASGYTWHELYPFVVSLRRCGYEGRAVLIIGDGPHDAGHPIIYERGEVKADLSSKLEDHGIETINLGNFPEHPILARFPTIADAIDKSSGLRYALSMDTKDIVFQYDPTKWLERHLGDKQIAVQSEETTYAKSEGNKRNCILAFGEETFERMRDEDVLNAGVICGTPSWVSRLHRDIYNLTLTDMRMKRGEKIGYEQMIADQTALNILLRQPPYSDVTKIVHNHEGFVYEGCLYGSIAPHTLMTSEQVVELASRTNLRWDDDMTMTTNDGSPYAVVHQYFAVSEWIHGLRGKFEG
jgi:hypothetical protein